MIYLTNPITWNQDHYGFHLTHMDQMDKIIAKGLKPRCGERSQSVNDPRKAIFFFEDPRHLEGWIERLYPHSERQYLELLRFNLKGRKGFYSDQFIGDFFLQNPVRKESIQYLRLVSPMGKLLPTVNYEEATKVQWHSLEEYEPIHQKKKTK